MSTSDTSNTLSEDLQQLTISKDQEINMWKQKALSLEKEVHDLQERAIQCFSRTEAEEEGLINKLMKRLNDLKHEKATLAIEVEKEEELISNTLTRRLNAVLLEKVELENRLEQEQEYIVNKLSKELVKLRKEKEALALEVEREEELIVNKLQTRLDRERQEKEDLANQVNRLMQDKSQLAKVLCGEQGLVPTLKNAIEVIKSRKEFKPEELQVLIRISNGIEDLVQLGSAVGADCGGGAGIEEQQQQHRCS